jgi:hypothetical protein
LTELQHVKWRFHIVSTKTICRISH